eukprot:gb/GECH01014840.1/.p1 GENE.gb/GECH01014840.1/~~gb/GECH01014840.1/.p1  ORF type:complete len:537 (+),score=132.24 gb/GECH01014840.1/:1-1611(+)
MDNKFTVIKFLYKPKVFALVLLILGILNFAVLFLLSSRAEKKEKEELNFEHHIHKAKLRILSEGPPTYNINNYLTAEEALSGFFQFQQESTIWLRYVLSLLKDNYNSKTKTEKNHENQEIIEGMIQEDSNEPNKFSHQLQQYKKQLSQFRSIVYVGRFGGLGNRFRSLAGTLLLAMLSGRVIFVDWMEPIPLEFLFEMEDLISWDINGAEETLVHEFLLPSSQDKSLQYVSRFDLMKYEKPKTTSKNEQLLKSSDNLRLLFSDNTRTILLKSYSPFYEILWENNNIKPGLEEMFGTPDEFLSFSLMNIIRPTYSVHQLIHSVAWENDIEYNVDVEEDKGFDQFIIGVQLRTGNVYSETPFLSEFTIEQIRQCVLNTIHELIQARDNEENHPLLQDYKSKIDDENIKFAIFLSTDDSSQYNEWELSVRNALPNEVKLFWIDEPVVHSGTEFKKIDKRKNMEADQSTAAHIKVAADFWILANSNLLFTTKYSSFGKVASLINTVESGNFVMPKDWPSCCSKQESEFQTQRDKNKLAER